MNATVSGFLLRRRGDLLIVLVAMAVVGLGFLTAPSLWESIDYVLFYKANFQFLKESVFEGRLPLWNPHLGLGRPFLADVQNSVFYPPVYLVLLGPGSGAFLLVWLHVLLAIFGMRALGSELGMSRPVSLLVAVSFAGSLILTGRFMAGQILYACALCYLPALFWCACRLDGRWNGRLIAGYALTLALQFLCGHPQVFWFSILGQFVFVVLRNLGVPRGGLAVAQFGISAGLCLGLIAVVLLPFLELVSQGNRAVRSMQFADFGRLEWLDLFGLLTDPPPGQLVDWEKNLFIGGMMAVAGIAGLARLRDRNCRALLATLLFAVLAAVGNQTPLFGVFYDWLPGFSSFRVHARSAALVSFALLVSAGIWLSQRRATMTDWTALTLAGGTTLLLVWEFCGKSPGREPGPTLAFWLTLVSTGVLFLSLAIRGRDPRLGVVILAAVGLLQGVDLMNANLESRSGYAFLNIQKTTSDFPYQSALAAFLQENGLDTSNRLPARVLVSRKIIPANFGMLHHYGSVDAYTSLFLRRPWEYLHQIFDLEEPKMKNTSIAEKLHERDPFSRPELAVDVGMNPQTRRFLLNPRPEPRAFLVHETVVVGSAREALDHLKAGHDVRRSALVEQDLRLNPPGASAASSETRVMRWEPNSVTIELNNPAPALLVMAEAWYPGWKIRVNGISSDALPANGWMRAFQVPPGRHNVEVYFHQNHLATGGAVSAISIIVCLVLIRSSRRDPEPRT